MRESLSELLLREREAQTGAETGEFACGIPERPTAITISKPPAIKPLKPAEVQNVEQAMAAIITVCKDDLGLLVVDPVYVYLYKNLASFAYYGHGWNKLPFDVAHQVAFAQGNGKGVKSAVSY